jgi:hypothetical protein
MREIMEELKQSPNQPDPLLLERLRLKRDIAKLVEITKKRKFAQGV